MAASVLQLSDVHMTADPGGRIHDRDPAARLAAVVEAAQAVLAEPLEPRSLDLVLLTGDITDDATVTACQRVADAIAPFGAAVLAVPGNHDGGPEVTEVFGPADPVELGPGWRVIALNSRLAGRVEGAVDPDEVLAALDAVDARPTLLALHHPPIGTSTHPWFQLGGAAPLLAGLAERPHVSLVVTGHLHQPFEQASGDLVLLGGPSTVYAIRHDGDGWQADDTVPTGARLLHLEDDGSWRSELVTAGPPANGR